jgi:FixJ family two-component response regulator
MQRQEALTQAAREVLHALVKDSPYTSRHIAEQVGELPSTLTHRLKGNRRGYQNLDTSLVVNILTVIGVPFTDYATQVESRAAQLLQESRRPR